MDMHTSKTAHHLVSSKTSSNPLYLRLWKSSVFPTFSDPQGSIRLAFSSLSNNRIRLNTLCNERVKF